MSRMYTMAEQPTITGKRRFEARDSSTRRRITDNPQPLDYVTQELVSEIIEKQQQTPQPPPKSFIQKLLRAN